MLAAAASGGDSSIAARAARSGEMTPLDFIGVPAQSARGLDRWFRRETARARRPQVYPKRMARPWEPLLLAALLVAPASPTNAGQAQSGASRLSDPDPVPTLPPSTTILAPCTPRTFCLSSSSHPAGVALARCGRRRSGRRRHPRRGGQLRYRAPRVRRDLRRWVRVLGRGLQRPGWCPWAGAPPLTGRSSRGGARLRRGATREGPRPTGAPRRRNRRQPRRANLIVPGVTGCQAPKAK